MLHSTLYVAQHVVCCVWPPSLGRALVICHAAAARLPTAHARSNASCGPLWPQRDGGMLWCTACCFVCARAKVGLAHNHARKVGCRRIELLKHLSLRRYSAEGRTAVVTAHPAQSKGAEGAKTGCRRRPENNERESPLCQVPRARSCCAHSRTRLLRHVLLWCSMRSYRTHSVTNGRLPGIGGEAQHDAARTRARTPRRERGPSALARIPPQGTQGYTGYTTMGTRLLPYG